MIQPMAFYCCGIRAQDALDRPSVISDSYAARFMTTEGWSILNRFSTHGDKHTRQATLVRGRIFQDAIAQHLRANPQLQIVNIGAGFDSRPYRMAGGSWVEIDEHVLIDYKSTHLSVKDCRSPLWRIGVDFDQKGSMAEALGMAASHFYANNPDDLARTLVVIEGMLMYLERAQVELLLKQVQEAFPRHALMCDLIDKTFIERFMNANMRQQLDEIGSPFKLREDHPEQLFLDRGYGTAGTPVSIAARTRDFKLGPPVPKLLLNTALKSLRDGYRVWAFEHE
jgi:methyltransferase (TIGR00027 family)